MLLVDQQKGEGGRLISFFRQQTALFYSLRLTEELNSPENSLGVPAGFSLHDLHLVTLLTLTAQQQAQPS